MIDVSWVEEQTAEGVFTTDAAKQIIEQGMRNSERLTGARIKEFRIWRANEKANVIKFSVEKDKEAAFRQTAAEWLEPHIPGARLVGPGWYPVKVDWIEVLLAVDVESGKVSKVGHGAFWDRKRSRDVHDEMAWPAKAQRAACVSSR